MNKVSAIIRANLSRDFTLEDVIREEIPGRRAKEGVEEELFTTDTSTVTDTLILLLVKGIEQCAIDKVCGPN